MEHLRGRGLKSAYEDLESASSSSKNGEQGQQHPEQQKVEGESKDERESGDILVLDKRALHDAWREIEREESGFKVPQLQKLDNPTIIGGKRIYLTKTTLIIVPQPLIAHWLEQIAYCCGGRRRQDGIQSGFSSAAGALWPWIGPVFRQRLPEI